MYRQEHAIVRYSQENAYVSRPSKIAKPTFNHSEQRSKCRWVGCCDLRDLERRQQLLEFHTRCWHIDLSWITDLKVNTRTMNSRSTNPSRLPERLGHSNRDRALV